MIEPRLVTIEGAAQRCGISPGAYRDWQQRGIVPGPLAGTKRYDLHAIDRALDRLSKLDADSTGNAPSPYDEWKAGQGDAA